MSEAQAEPVPFYKTVKTVSSRQLAHHRCIILTLWQRFQDLDVSNGVDVDLFCSSCDAVIAFFGKANLTRVFDYTDCPGRSLFQCAIRHCPS
jgi:hypothetical protein